MMSHRKIVSFRETDQVIQYLDAKAEAQGIDRSDILRMLIRKHQRQEADSIK